MRRNSFGLLVVVGLLGATIGAAFVLSPREASETMSVATGNPSGLYYPLGGGMASLWSEHLEGVNMKAEVTAGSVTNLIQVAREESDVAFSQGDAARDAILGAGRFREPLPLRVVARLYPNVVHLLAVQGGGIESVDDVRGKRLSVGPPGSGNAVTAWNILTALGITENDFLVRQLNYTEIANGLKDGTLDAGFITGGIGISAVVELAIARDVVLVPFTDDEMAAITARVPAYSSFSVPSGVYRGVETPVQTPTLWNLLVVHEQMEEELVYRLLGTIFDHHEELLNISQVARFITPESAMEIGDLPLHPGATRYYDELLHTSAPLDQ
jgi:TRAP transporter TAXI family solute receptor